ncbi:MAG: hypothetical protein OHK0038_08510 [Flammeovirgaceae bacterium]
MSHFRNTFGSKTEKGKKKLRLEDSLLTSTLPQGYLFVLSTGLGEEGELLARIVATSLRFYFQHQPHISFDANSLKSALEYAHTELIRTIEKNTELLHSGAQVTILSIHDNKAFFASVGSNNLYFLRNQNIINLTEKNINNQPIDDKSFVQQFIGKQNFSPYISYEPIILEKGDSFCISSKTLSNNLSTDEIKNILIKEDITTQAKAELLVSNVQKKTNDESISVLVVQHFLMEEYPQNLPIMENKILENKTNPDTFDSDIDEDLDKTSEKILRSYKQRTLLAFILFSIFILMLYFYKVDKWNIAINKMDSLEQVANQTTKKLLLLEKQEKLKSENIKNHYFDSFDNDKYRVYGLLRDKEKKYKISEISTMFNIFNTNAIKVSEVMGEQWFIVPVKGVHFMQAGENATSLAKKYYTDAADSILIKKFNPNLEPYRHVFIPFNK